MKINKFNCRVIVASFIAFSFTGCSSGGGSSSSSTTIPPLCGTTVYPSNTGVLPPAPILESSQVWSFVSAPNLHPMKVNVSPYDPNLLASGYIFNGPFAFSSFSTMGQSGALIADNDGNPIWFNPLSDPSLVNMDFRVQKLYGSPVLVFMQGTLGNPPTYTNVPAGSAEPGSCFYIMNNSYELVKTVSAFNGFTTDGHEMLITPENTALFFGTKVVPMDLTKYGGPESGSVFDFSIQEVDLATNKLIFFWDALEHIPLESSHLPAINAYTSNNIWDPYHLNAISLISGSKNDIVFSSRNTWTIYRLNKPSGKFVWQLAGDGSGDFAIPESSAQFSWQHDVSYVSESVVSMFNDDCCQNSAIVPPGTTPSHGLILNLNFNTMVATIESSYYHSESLFTPDMGSFQWLDNGNKFIGWGSNNYYSEFAESGNTEADPKTSMLYDAQMPGNNVSYRSYRLEWIGTPTYPPSAVAKTINKQQTVVYVSWNGSTETKFWQVYAGSSASSLEFVASTNKTGFETAIPILNNNYSYFQVKAVDTNGRVIGVSSIIEPVK